MSKYIQRFSVIPKDLFRVNNGPSITLRDRTVKKTGPYDLVTEAGKVKPKALDPNTYAAPNGASMRPNTPKQNNLVKTLKGADVIVYAIPKGTQLPNGLVLVHEFRDHYSLQASIEMTLAELNANITNFLSITGQRLTKVQWLQKYPQPTETS
ncbi:hypothetical protein MMC07_002204 [Pseudocyphellaria aurata]|nr:hypothetical protein [Pseudocyphellaria aurata]